METATLTLLKESGAMLEGHFLLSSGRHSDKYFQCAKLLQFPEKAAAAFSGVAERIRCDMQAGMTAGMAVGRLEIDLVAGPAIGGIIAAYELGRQLGLPVIFTERDETGTMALRRGFEIRPGQKVLITEDVVTTGKSFGECAFALESLGAKVTALACIVDRRQKNIEVPWPFYPACKVDVLSWEPEICELCKKGIPVVKPGSRQINR